MKKGKKILAVLLSVFLLAAFAPFCLTVFAASGGSCGSNVSYNLSNGVLRIYGSGDMKDYAKTQNVLTGKSRAPWYDESREIVAIEIMDSVRYIGEYAFYDCINAATVTVGTPALNEIGKYAFDDCGSLQDVIFTTAPVSQFNNINVKGYNSPFENARRHSHMIGGGTMNTQTVTVSEATCTQPKRVYDRRTCSVCGYLIEESSVYSTGSASGHIYSGTWQQTASYHIRSCTRCGTPEQTAHTFGDGVVLLAPTATTEGQMQYTCTACGYEKYETIPAEGGSGEPVAAAIADPLANALYTTEQTPGYDWTLCLELDPYRDNYEAAGHGPAIYTYSLDNTVYDQNGNPMGTAAVTVTSDLQPGGIYYENEIRRLVIRSDYVIGRIPQGPVTFTIEQRYGELVQTTSVFINISAHSDYKSFLFRDAEGEPFLVYRYEFESLNNYSLQAVEPINLLQTASSIRAWETRWMDAVLTPYFTHYQNSSGYDGYLVNQRGILPVTPDKAPDTENHYVFDHWATDATLPGSSQPLDLSDIGEWYNSFMPNYSYAVFYPVYTATAHTFEEHTDVLPTCAEAGSGHFVCSACGYAGAEYKIPATGNHTPQNVAATDATATEHGFTAGVQCADCGEWLSGHDVIHNTLGARTVLAEPTQDSEGEAIIVCTVCGESGLYAIEKLPPAETSDEDNNDNVSPLERIRKAINSFVDWVLRLIRWLGRLQG